MTKQHVCMTVSVINLLELHKCKDNLSQPNAVLFLNSKSIILLYSNNLARNSVNSYNLSQFNNSKHITIIGRGIYHNNLTIRSISPYLAYMHGLFTSV